MNILLIDSSTKDGQYMSTYLKSRNHNCDWLKELDEVQPADGTLKGLDSTRHPRQLSLTEYNLALVEGQLFNTELGVDIAIKLARANIVRVAVGGIEGSKKFMKAGVFNFAINRATFYAQVDEVMEVINGVVFQPAREKSNRTLLSEAAGLIRRGLKKFRRKAAK